MSGIVDLFRRKTGDEKYPPSGEQRGICRRLGLTIEPGTSKAAVARVLVKALRDPRNQASERAHQHQVAEELERDDREEYGDAPVDERKKWEALSQSAAYLIVLRRGKKVLADVVTLGSPDIVGDGKYHVEMELSFFKISREDGHPCLDWAKDLTVRTADILHIELVAEDTTYLEVEEYKTLRARGANIAATLAKGPASTA